MDTSTKKPVKKLNGTTKANQKKLMAIFIPRIDAGVKYLDKHMGREKWLAKINENRLMLENANTCVCGQIFGDFWTHVFKGMDRDMMSQDEQNKVLGEKAVPYGFYVEGALQDKYMYVYDVLTHLWAFKIATLRHKAGMPLMSQQGS